MAGLSPDAPGVQLNGSDVHIEDDPGEDIRHADDFGAIIKIEHPDGSVTISIDGGPVEPAEDEGPAGWFDNLVDKIDGGELSRISDDLLRGVEDDLQSRKSWIDDRANGVKMMGLSVDVPGVTGSADGAPVEGMSRVRHPLMQEAVLRFQANARSELLPTDGPVKIRNDGNGSDLAEDQLANALQKDLNHYLTVTASEYYPDTDRMLLMLGFGGMTFKKVYNCPLRNRPVSETVDANDLIVNNAATDLKNAQRVTHRIYMRPSIVKRLQILGVYKDMSLPTPHQVEPDALKRVQLEQQGVESEIGDPEDRTREIYEVYCELDIQGFEHRHKRKISGLEIPYRVTIDVSSREILSIIRNYDEETGELPEARETFVPYLYIPGFGFYGIGLLHILGNTTNAVTAAWRELLDAGMFNSFPGFLMADTGMRQNTNIFRVPPGGGASVKTGGMSLKDAIMPLPYGPPSPALMQLVDNIVTTGMRVGGTAEAQVGEGRADVPVGTMLAMIDMATKVQNAVHKRMHTAQAHEFRLLVECFRENPQAFWQRNKKPAYPWDEATFLKALDDHELTPQADPNTASQTQRLMKIAALKELQKASPQLYDPIAIDMAALQAIGWNNPQSLMAPPEAQGRPAPEMIGKAMELAIKQQEANTQTTLANAKVALDQAKVGLDREKMLHDTGQQPTQNQTPAPELAAKLLDAHTRAQESEFKMRRAGIEDQNRDKDRAEDTRLEEMKLQFEDVQHQHDMELERERQRSEMISDHVLQAKQHEHDLGLAKAAAKAAPKRPAKRRGGLVGDDQ